MSEMTKPCVHVGKAHPYYFSCIDCDDQADECNCNSCAGVFCDICQKLMWVSCGDVQEAWYETYPNRDMNIDGATIRYKKLSYEDYIHLTNEEKDNG